MTNYNEQFNLRKRHPFAKLYLLSNTVQSLLARLMLSHSLDVSYGSSPGEKIDIFPAAKSNAPVFIFIHGGYFRALDKKQYNYMAMPLVSAGYTVLLLNYDLAPSVTVREIVKQVKEAFLWVYQNINQWNGDPKNITICGHSVGAYLAAKILEFDWEQEIRNGISGVSLLSGLYDLSSMRKSYLNDTLKLSEDDVSYLNLTFAHIEKFPPIIVAVGENETDEFILQSKNYFEHLKSGNVSSEFLLLENKNHYSVSRMLSSKNNLLMQKTLGLSTT